MEGYPSSDQDAVVVFGIRISPFALPWITLPGEQHHSTITWRSRSGPVPAQPDEWWREEDETLVVGWGGYAEYRVEVLPRPRAEATVGSISEADAASAFIFSVLPLALPLFGPNRSTAQPWESREALYSSLGLQVRESRVPPRRWRRADSTYSPMMPQPLTGKVNSGRVPPPQSPMGRCPATCRLEIQRQGRPRAGATLHRASAGCCSPDPRAGARSSGPDTSTWGAGDAGEPPCERSRSRGARDPPAPVAATPRSPAQCDARGSDQLRSGSAAVRTDR